MWWVYDIVTQVVENPPPPPPLNNVGVNNLFRRHWPTYHAVKVADPFWESATPVHC